LAGVDPERAGGRELAELVADHRFGDVEGHVPAAVVDRDQVLMTFLSPDAFIASTFTRR
jgi:hypothetical protein